MSGVGRRVVTTHEQLDGVDMRVDELPQEFLEALIMVWEARGDHHYPIVNEYASAPGSRKVISSVRSRTRSCSRASW